MNIIQVDPSNRRQVNDFLRLPARVYQGIPPWVPPLAGEERLRLDRKHYPFYQHSEAAFFLADEAGNPQGRLAVLDNALYNQHNHEKTAFFTLFESFPNPQAAVGLFEAAFSWARKRGLVKMVGPKGFTALDGMGLLVKGFEHRPAFGLPYNPPYYPELIESLGFTGSGDIASGYINSSLQFPQRIHDLAERLRERRGLQITCFHNRFQLRRALGHLQELYNGALGGTTDGTPITAAEIKILASQMIWFADPQLIKIVMKGARPVGFLMAYPDISAALQKTKGRLFPFGWWTFRQELRTTDWININGAGMLEEYRGSGGTAILYSELFKSVSSNSRYRHAEVVQIGMENDKMQRELANFGVDFYKIHRMYQRTL